MAPGSSTEAYRQGGPPESWGPQQLLQGYLQSWDGPEDDVGAWGCETAKFKAHCAKYSSQVESAVEQDLWRIDTCPEGHQLKAWVTPGGVCNGCRGETPQGARVLDCRECDWYLCCRCQPHLKEDQDDSAIRRTAVAGILSLHTQIDAPPVCNTLLVAIPVIAACLAFVSHCEGWPPLADGLLFPGVAPPAHDPTAYVVADSEVMWGPRLGGRELLERQHRRIVRDEVFLREPIFAGCGVAARKHVLHDAESDTYFSTLLDVPVDGAELSCHDRKQPVKVPCGWELATDSRYIVSNVVASHNWSTHVVVLGSGNGYSAASLQPGTSGFMPGSQWTWGAGLGGDAESGYYANYCMHQLLIQHVGDADEGGRGAWEVEQERPVIFDVGAGLGVATAHFASRIPRARIFAFEPSPQAFELLQRNAGNLKMRYRRYGAVGGGSCAGSVLYGGPVSSQGQCQLMCSNRESCNYYVFWDSFVSGNALNGRPWCRLTTSCESRSRELNPRNLGTNMGTAFQKEAAVAGRAATAALYMTAVGADKGRVLALRYWKESASVSLPNESHRPAEEYEDFTCNVTALSSVIVSHGLQRVDILKVTSALGGLDVLRSVQERHWPMVRQVVVGASGVYAEVSSFLRQRGFQTKEQPSPSGDVFVYAIRP